MNRRRNQPPSLDGPIAKVARAEVHYAQVVDAWNRIVLSEPSPYSYSVDVADDGRRHTYRVVTYPTVDPEWGLILGDAVHNLRSALDHLAWQLVLANGGVPKEGGGGTQFPVYSGARDVSVATDAGEVHPEAMKVINDAQPRNGGDDGKHLALINSLDIMDKHRYLIVTAMGSDSYMGSADAPPIIERGRSDPTVNLEAGDIAAWFVYASALPQPDPKLNLLPGISFEEGPLGGESFMEIGYLLRWTREFVTRFTPYFERRPL